MKKWILLLVVIGFSSLLQADERPAFATFEAVQKYYLDVLAKSEGKSFDEFMAVLYGKVEDKVDTTSMRALYDVYIKAAGPIVYCESLSSFSLGSRIKKGGYLIKHKEGLTFIEMIFYKGDEGWKFVNWNMQFNVDSNEITSKIPEAYWAK